MTKKPEKTYIIWYVLGEAGHVLPTFFHTKMGAEKWARELFPTEAPDKRYARVLSTMVYDNEEIA